MEETKIQILYGINDMNLDLFYAVEKNIYRNDDKKVYQEKEGMIDDILSDSIYLHNNDIEIFIGLKEGVPVARTVVALDKSKVCSNERRCLFSKFESINDKAVVAELFSYVLKWCEERDISTITGPMTEKVTDSRGILLEGAGKPVVFMPYNPTYYDSLLTELKFNRLKKMIEFIIDIKPPYIRLHSIKEAVIKRYPNIMLKGIDIDNLENEMKKISDLYNIAWKNNWGFIPIKWEDLYKAALKYKDLMGYSSIVELNGQYIAFQMVVPDINQIYCQGEYDFSKIGSIDAYRALFIGVHPGYRSVGVEALMYDKVINEICIKSNIRKFHVGWVLEDNIRMIQQLKNLGKEENINYKYYELYERKV